MAIMAISSSAVRPPVPDRGASSSTRASVALAQLRQVFASVATLGAPALVAGDLNLRPGPVRAASRGWLRAAARTFPVTAPDRQIDHLLLRPGPGARALTGARSLPLPVSDHRGLTAELRS